MKWNNIKISQKDIRKIADYDSCAEAPMMASDDGKIQGAEASENFGDDERVNVFGMHSTSCTYYGLLNPICKYALTKLVAKDSKPTFVTGGKYSDGPATQEIPTDVTETDTVYMSLTAIYDDKIVTASENYGEFTVCCYTKNKDDSKKYISNLKNKMLSDNQYRGKCLFYGNKSIDFREEADVDWDDVVLPEKSKTEILRNTSQFLTNDRLRKHNMNQRGVILHGPPGTGKTMVVKSLFSSLKGQNITRLYATADTFSYPSDMNDLFDFLKFTGATSLAFEDMDLISPDRSEHGDGRKILGSLLNNLDGIRKLTEPFVIVGTTNDIEMLDRAIANRPCRFDRKIEIGIPDESEIGKFYKLMSGVDVNESIVKLSSGFAGAHIQEVVNTAKLLSVESGKDVSECIAEACEIIKENFFPMTKEASATLYKNDDGKMSKEAQSIMMLLPQGVDPSRVDFTNIIPFLTQGITDPNSVNNKEATALWSTWKNQEGNVKDNKIKASDIDPEVLRSLKNKNVISEVVDGHFSLTDSKGKKLMRELILTQEVNAFEKVAEDEEVDMMKMKNKIRGGSSSKKVKAASKEDSEPLAKSSDLHYEAVKNIMEIK
jgi:AAA+ superfamily predicted ATPase